MLNKFLSCLFLLHISVSYTMKSAPTSRILTLSNDLIIYHISPRFDRIDRNNFRLTNKKHAELILPQALLNSDYQQAREDKNISAIHKLRKQGALEPLEEVCKLAIDIRMNRNTLAKKMWNRFPKEEITINGLKYGVTQNNLPFVAWILKTSHPTYWSQTIRDSLALSEKLNHRAVTVYFKDYISREEYYAFPALPSRNTSLDTSDN